MTTDLVHRFASLSESSDTLGSAALTGTLVPPLWKSAIFWNVLLEMECIAIVLLSTGFYCLSSRGYLFQGTPVIPFSDPGLYFLAS